MLIDSAKGYGLESSDAENVGEGREGEREVDEMDL
jgi:hypothetical protein